MLFKIHPLSPPLSDYIESVFHFKDFMPDHSIERVVPTGHLFLIFELDDRTRHTFDNETLQPNASFTKVWISGMHRNYISISAHEKSEMFVIQFKAFGAHPFFHFPIQDLNDKVVPAEDILGEQILQLRENLFQQESSEDKFQLAEQWLQERFDAQKAPPLALQQILQQLQSKPISKYNEVLEAYPHTQKHLIDQFKKYVGLTPKSYQRILRFNEILQQIRNKEKVSWTQVVYNCGYSDQSHFIKEFKHFSGFNPEEFLGQDFNQDEANFFPLD